MIDNITKKKLFEEIYSENLHKIRFFAFSYLHNKDESECIAQEVFAVFWDKMETLNLENSACPYLFTITKNKCCNVLRSRRIRKTHSYDEGEEKNNFNLIAAERADSNILSNDLRHKVEISLGEMSNIVRETFLLSREKSMTYPQLAKLYNVTEKAIEFRMMSALRILRKHCRDFLIFILGYIIINVRYFI